MAKNQETIQEVMNNFFTDAAALYANYGQRMQDAANVWGGDEKDTAVTKERSKGKTAKKESAEVWTQDSLDELKLGDLRKLFAELSGGKDAPSGGKKNIVKAILELQKGKKRKDSDEDEDIEDEELEDSDDEEGEISEAQKAVEAALKGVSEDAIKDICKKLKISATGRREALIARIVASIEDEDSSVTLKKFTKLADAAYEDEPKKSEKASSKKKGKEEADEDEDEDEDSDDDEDSDEDSDDDEDDSDEEADEDEDEDDAPPSYTDKEVATKARAEAMAALEKKIGTQIKKGKLTEADMKKYCITFYGKGKYDAKKLKNAYIEARLRMIDDEGVERKRKEQYVLNEYVACCGFYADDDPDDEDVSVCASCGTKYSE